MAKHSGKGSLAGRRILVTRSADQAPALSEALAARGAEPVLVPTIEIVAPGSFADLDLALVDLDGTDFLVLTSTNAVEAFFNRLPVLGKGPDDLAGVQIVAVGPKSAAALDKRGVPADLVPDDYRAEGVVALLKDRVAGKRVLYPKAALARDLIPAGLRAAGAEVADPVAYASAPPAGTEEKLRQALAAGLDLLTFTASSTVDNFVALLDQQGLLAAREVPVASIGPLTSATAEQHGFRVAVEPDKATLEDMVEAIARYFAQG